MGSKGRVRSARENRWWCWCWRAAEGGWVLLELLLGVKLGWLGGRLAG